jgi:3,4-dihydroxy 2-butanone 4-phosphate synthase
MGAIEGAAKALRAGKRVVIYDGDGREGEADLAFHASFAGPKMIETMRKDAGGLICVAIDAESAGRLELPFYTDVLSASKLPVCAMECTMTAYGDKPAFAIQVNHRNVYTGITDDDRALTIRSLAELMGLKPADMKERFFRDFYSPGHVFLLIGRGIENRRGHTELSLELARRANMSGAVALCEMLGSGKALSKSGAMEYAEKNGLPFLEGSDF